MNRVFLKKLLKEYKPASFPEKETKKEITQFVEQNADCFERSLLKGHITASAWLLSHDLQNVLLMHHKKLNKWVQFGGHCDGNSDVLEVALKETKEESGIKDIKPVDLGIFDLDIHLIPENKKEPKHYHYDIRFLLKVEGSERGKQNEESNEIKWFSRYETLPSNEESILRMKKKWIDHVDVF